MEDNEKILLPKMEAEAIKDLEELSNKEIPRVKQIKWWESGYIFYNGHIISLSLGSRGLKYLPNSLGNLRDLEEIWLSGNELGNLPDSFGKLIKLKKLYLRNNKLTNLSEWFGYLLRLETVYLSYNQLTVLPNSFGNLENLKELYLTNNEIYQLPTSFTQLQTLKILNLRGNNLKNLPESFGELKTIENLDLGRNYLTNLPESFQFLTELKDLNLSRNFFKDLPPSIWSLKKLEHLELKNNPWKPESAEIIKTNMSNIRVILDHCRKKAYIRIYLSYDIEDVLKFRVNQLAGFLEKQPEIYKVFLNNNTDEEKLQEFSEEYLPECQLMVLITTENSLFASNKCKYERELAKDLGIGIILVVDNEISHEMIKSAGLNNELRLNYSGYKFNEFSNRLYNLISEYKKDVNLFSRYLAKFEKNKFLLKNYFINILNSEEFEKFYIANYPDIKEQLDEIDDSVQNQTDIINKLLSIFFNNVKE